MALFENLTSLPPVNSTENSSWLDEDDDTMDDATLYFVTSMLSFFCVIGTVGNILVLYVFSQKKDRLTSTVFILALACVDLFTCMVSVPYTIYMELRNFDVPDEMVCKTYFFFITSNVPCSALIMVSIAIDRYLCICHPFWHAMTIFRAKVLVVMMSMIAGGMGVITSILYKTEDGICVVDMNYAGFIYYYHKCYSALYLLCLIIVLVLYLFIYRSVITRRTKRAKQKSKALPLILTKTKKSDSPTLTIETEIPAVSTEKQNGDNPCPDIDPTQNLLPNSKEVNEPLENGKNFDTKKKSKEQKKKEKQEKKKESSAHKKDNLAMANLKTAAMLFVVTVVFIVTYAPALLMGLAIIPNNYIIYYMYYANNVINPVIYSFMNKNFRDDLRKIFCSKR